MTNASQRRSEAIRELRRFGICGPDVYLIDLIPLIEMIWADGRVQDAELDFLHDYLHRHVDRVNALADSEITSYERALDFIAGYLEKRPDPELLATLRDFVRPVRLSTSDRARDEALRKSLLSACLDIAASSVLSYPYEHGTRFDAEEKRTYFEILESL